MKILIYSDVHWSTYSSILRSRGERYSTYLHGIINSVNWVMDLASELGCKATICAGDFFDKSSCTAEELSALKEIRWAEVPHYFLCGNHELGDSSHIYSSAKVFDLLPCAKVIDKPDIVCIGDKQILFLPYILESDRKPINEHFSHIEEYLSPNISDRILISHEDISGIQMGAFTSKTGFSIDELSNFAGKVINGHLHNGAQIADNILNIGSLSAINFSNDSLNYIYGAFVLDTDTMEILEYENPYSFNFYKFDATKSPINFNCLKPNAVVSIRCNAEDAEYYREEIKKYSKIIQSRVILDFNSTSTNTESQQFNIEDLSVDHINEFKKFIISALGDDDIVKDELFEVCK